MIHCFFVSDLHGRISSYEKLFLAVAERSPRAVFIGGDILPHTWPAEGTDFLDDFFLAGLERLRGRLGGSYPRVFVILGNDDGRWPEARLREASMEGLLSYIHGAKGSIDGYAVYGYAYMPPSPFLLKDWERYDVSRYVDPGSISPEEGRHTEPVDPDEVRFGTIEEDLRTLAGDDDLERAVFLFHAPPYKTMLDRAALDGRTVDHSPLDVHVGSIAIRRFIESRQPLITLHGHIHESARLTGSWKDRLGRTVTLTAAHDGPELALVTFDLEDPAAAERTLI